MTRELHGDGLGKGGCRACPRRRGRPPRGPPTGQPGQRVRRRLAHGRDVRTATARDLRPAGRGAGPPDGGDTNWAYSPLAHESLSPGLRTLTDPLTAVHDGSREFGYYLAQRRKGRGNLWDTPVRPADSR
ncbi:hypothetical protein GCM10010345_60300 [Streptomyces canarius]|uniref:Uncharacterized protein n=1 Tax=Streptomyces canarius TaxID=285453 RepID=A0ABQ3D278_9ACTN|nr:hypothetical protein GCM10010345_60300 [Streptomyces canarius]